MLSSIVYKREKKKTFWWERCLCCRRRLYGIPNDSPFLRPRVRSESAPEMSVEGCISEIQKESFAVTMLLYILQGDVTWFHTPPFLLLLSVLSALDYVRDREIFFFSPTSFCRNVRGRENDRLTQFVCFFYLHTLRILLMQFSLEHKRATTKRRLMWTGGGQFATRHLVPCWT